MSSPDSPTETRIAEIERRSEHASPTIVYVETSDFRWLIDQLRASRKDSKRLDRYDEECRDTMDADRDGEAVFIGYRWSIQGNYENVREAIDAELMPADDQEGGGR